MGYGFAAPAWLAALAILVPLLWLYLRSRRRPPAVVSSLVVWRVLTEAAAPRRKPYLPLLFFVQAALIVASVIALAQPFVQHPVPPGPPRDAIVVLDVSASMQARDGGSTRFERARAAAQERAYELGRSGRKLTVIAAGQQPQVVGTQLDGARAADLIGRLEPRDTSGNLTAAAELAAAQAGPQGSIDVFTDAAGDGLVMSRDARAISTVHRFGSGGDNVAVAGVRVLANPFEPLGRTRALVTLHSYADEAREVTITLEPVEAASGEPAQPVSRTVTLAPGATEVVSADGFGWSGAFRAVLAPDDDLPLDNVVYGVVPAPTPLRVLLVTEDIALQRAVETLARSLGNVTVRTLVPVQYRPEAREEITIFDRFAPPLPPAGNVAYLAPPRGNPDVTVAGGATRGRVAEQREHELVAGVQNAETLLGDGVALAASAALKPVLLGRAEGREVPLVLAGEVGGRRIVATSFPLRAADLRSADALPTLVFTINLLRWLSPTSGAAPLTRIAGERLRAGFRDAAPIARIEGPDGARELGPAEEITLERAGVYAAVGGGEERTLLVSFVDPVESDIARPAAAPSVAAPPRPATAEPAAQALWQRVPYVREALLAALLAMLLEWLVVAASGPRARRGGPGPSDAAADPASAGGATA
ncbi:MAG: BatA domain-containing protein [Thermodesulfobacteriota bacterium]